MSHACTILRSFALLLCAVALAAAAAPVAYSQGSPNCKQCVATGREPCPKHPKGDAAAEDRVEYCSVIAACESCGGAGFVICRKCGGSDAARAALEAKRKLVASHTKSLAVFDETMGRPLRKSATKHFEVAWELEHVKVDKRELDGHELLHLYSDRMERLFTDYTSLFRASEDEFADRSRVFVWWLVPDQRKASVAFCSQSGDNGVMLLGAHSAYSLCGNRQFFTSDERLHRNLVHCVTHLLMSHQRPANWIGNLKAGWADEGLAHWFENKYFGVCDTYCYQEQNTNTDFKSGKYLVAVRKMVATDKVPSVAVMFERNSDSLLSEEHAVAFSYVDFLLQRDPVKFGSMCADLRQKMPSREALQKHFGLTPLVFEAEWKAWVLKTYPTQ